MPLYTISYDATGGDCTSIGVWDGSARTCTLSGSIPIPPGFDGIAITSPDITLRGPASVDGTGEPGTTGIIIDSVTGVTLQNISVSGFDTAIEVLDSSDVKLTGPATIDGTTTANAQTGVKLINVSAAILQGLDIGGYHTSLVALGTNGSFMIDSFFDVWTELDTDGGLVFDDSSANQVVGNTIILHPRPGSAAAGVYLDPGSAFNLLAGNQVSSNGSAAVIAVYGDNNELRGNGFSNGGRTFRGHRIKVVGNDFNATFVTPPDDQIPPPDDGIWALPAPVGGNYWSEFDTAAEGCQDLDRDGFCDAPFNIFGLGSPGAGQADAMPYSAPGGWCGLDPAISLSLGTPYWASLADYTQRVLTVPFEGDSFFDVFVEVNIEDTRNSNGVTAPGPWPLPADAVLPPDLFRPGARQWDFSLRYQVPAGVSFFTTTIFAAATDPCGVVTSYPRPPRA